MNACAVCGRALEQPTTGRRRRFCSQACRQLAYRLRHQAQQPQPSATAEATALLNAVFRHTARRQR